MTGTVLTIGHSNHSIDDFIGLLHRHGVTAVADVRSHPYSRRFPQFSRDALRDALRKSGIAYVFLGRELGARSDNRACYRHGRVQYVLLAEESNFAEGLARVRRGAGKYCIAMMCAEKDPLDCHRAILVGRKLYESGTSVSHIHADGTLESQNEMESRLLALQKMPEGGDMFQGREAFLQQAYALQGERIAYQDEAMLQAEESG